MRDKAAVPQNKTAVIVCIYSFISTIVANIPQTQTHVRRIVFFYCAWIYCSRCRKGMRLPFTVTAVLLWLMLLMVISKFVVENEKNFVL